MRDSIGDYAVGYGICCMSVRIAADGTTLVSTSGVEVVAYDVAGRLPGRRARSVAPA